jgi:hypothetical protein
MPAAMARSRARPARIHHLYLERGSRLPLGSRGLSRPLPGAVLSVAATVPSEDWAGPCPAPPVAPELGFWLSRGSWPLPERETLRGWVGVAFWATKVCAEGGVGGGLDLHGLGQLEGDGAGGAVDLDGEVELARVGDVVGDLEARFAGAEGEEEGVLVAAERDGRVLERHAAGG